MKRSSSIFRLLLTFFFLIILPFTIFVKEKLDYTYLSKERTKIIVSLLLRCASAHVFLNDLVFCKTLLKRILNKYPISKGAEIVKEWFSKID